MAAILGGVSNHFDRGGCQPFFGGGGHFGRDRWPFWGGSGHFGGGTSAILGVATIVEGVGGHFWWGDQPFLGGEGGQSF